MDNKEPKLFYSQLAVVIGLILLIIGLIGISVVSFFQTYVAFSPMNDDNMFLFNFKIGSYIALFMAFCIQYGQQGAMFIEKFICKNNVVLVIPFIKIKLTDKMITRFVFWVTALTDAGSNIIWFNQTVVIPEEIVSGMIVRVVGYSTMFLSVWSEETLGVVADAFVKAWKQLVSLIEYNQKMARVENNRQSTPANTQKNNNTQSNQTPRREEYQQQRSQPQYRPGYANPVTASGKPNQSEKPMPRPANRDGFQMRGNDFNGYQ